MYIQERSIFRSDDENIDQYSILQLIVTAQIDKRLTNIVSF